MRYFIFQVSDFEKKLKDAVKDLDAKSFIDAQQVQLLLHVYAFYIIPFTMCTIKETLDRAKL